MVFKLVSFWAKWRMHSTDVYDELIEMISQFLKTTGNVEPDEKTVLLSVVYSLLYRYRIAPSFEKKTLSFPDTQSTSYRNSQSANGNHSEAHLFGKGRILVRSHHAFSYAFKSAHKGCFRLGQIQKYNTAIDFRNEKIERIFYAQYIRAARDVLEKGGIVDVSADGEHGTSQGEIYEFHKRLWSFKTTFAELALLTNSNVYAVVLSAPETKTAALEGQRPEFSYVGPFQKADTKLPHDIQIKFLIDQYVRVLEAQWSEKPWIVPTYLMKKHLKYPNPQNA